ncbi:hypothetical protein V2G26_009183 [Clonostachys chloroleuca]
MVSNTPKLLMLRVLPMGRAVSAHRTDDYWEPLRSIQEVITTVSTTYQGTYRSENSLLQRLGKIARVRVWGSHLTSQIRQKSGWCQTQVNQLTAVLLLPSDETAVGTWPSSLRPTDSIGSHGGEAFYDAAFRFIGAWAIVYPCNRTCDHKRPTRKLDLIELRHLEKSMAVVLDSSLSSAFRCMHFLQTMLIPPITSSPASAGYNGTYVGYRELRSNHL